MKDGEDQFVNEEQKKQTNQIQSAPNLNAARKRGRETISYQRDFVIPEQMSRIGEGKKYYIRTYGCQMNEHDSEVMGGILSEMGFTTTDQVDEADIILLNTCAVRENAENRVFGEIGHLKSLKRHNPDVILGICGCMSQEEGVVARLLQKHHFVDLLFGTHNIYRLSELLQQCYMSKENVVEVWSKEGDIIENLPKLRQGGIKAWVNIMFGCDKFCTYCIVPYTRGKERSRRPEDIIQEVRELAASGYQEVTLLGQNVNAYGKDFVDLDYRFDKLLDDLRKIDIPRIRFTTSHPRDFNDDLIDVLAKGGNLMPHIHLPAQSGSTEMLKIMGRKHTREQYMTLVNKMKEKIPNLSLSTDLIVGFPNETREQFEDTLSLYQTVRYDIAYTFIYSPREGTPAAKMQDNVPAEEKKQRLLELNEIVNTIALEKNKTFEGKIVPVLVEGVSKKNENILSGYTPQNKLTNFVGPKSAIGKIVPVHITEAKTWSLNGEMISESERKV